MNLLRIVMVGEEDPHYTITLAFMDKFKKVDTIWWTKHNPDTVDSLVRKHYQSNSYDVVFMQLQNDQAVHRNTVEFMAERSLVFNWTGDVRDHLNFYTKYGDFVVTLFTNETDVEKMKAMGYRSDYLQVGYDHKYYFNTDAEYRYRQNAIVFCGNNYSYVNYPLSDYRVKAVQRLSEVFKDHFVLFGNGWSNVYGVHSSGIAGNLEEAKWYNYCSIAINLSHFNYKRYSSDRLFREMACGSLVLTHNFQEYEKDFENEHHFVVWNNIDDLINKCDDYLTDYKSARWIAKNGMQEAETKYRWSNVVDNFLELINKYK